jgi:hypothetical protein
MTTVELTALATLVGIVGGLAGVASIAWTVVWSVTLRPRARWSLNRFHVEELDPLYTSVFPNTPPTLHFYFRNVGTAAAHDAHALLSGASYLDRAAEFPFSGRLSVQPGEEIVVDVRAPVVDGNANRPYLSGDDAMFGLSGVLVKVRWRRQTVGFATRRFHLNRLQGGVPFV